MLDSRSFAAKRARSCAAISDDRSDRPRAARNKFQHGKSVGKLEKTGNKIPAKNFCVDGFKLDFMAAAPWTIRAARVESTLRSSLAVSILYERPRVVVLLPQAA